MHEAGTGAVRPGLTCFWQVSPSRYQISFDDWMRLDLKYVTDWNLRLDADLILRCRIVYLIAERDTAPRQHAQRNRQAS